MNPNLPCSFERKSVSVPAIKSPISFKRWASGPKKLLNVVPVSNSNSTGLVVNEVTELAFRITPVSLKRINSTPSIKMLGGDDGCIQGLLELLGIPYTGPGILASAVGMDKHMQQILLKAEGLGVPDSIVIHEKEWMENKEDVKGRIAKHFTFPVFTKPTREGSSVGVTGVKDEASLERGIEDALKYDNAILVEEYLQGIEFSCIVLEEDGEARPLDLTEIYPQSEYYTYDDKYMPGRCRKFTPPKNIPADVVKEIKAEVLKAYQALGFRSYGRIDGFLTKDGRILITDPNSSSGMAPSSFFFEQAAAMGMLPTTVISKLIQNAVEIHQEKKGPL